MDSFGLATTYRRAVGLVTLGLLGGLVACQTADDRVQSTLEGRITVEASVDTTEDYGGFRILVADAQGRNIDTLAHAVTDRSGRFQTTVRAPERGIYPLVLWGRDGRRRVGTTPLVVAEGDSARLKATVPRDARRLQVRSEENDALTGYRNTLAQHRQMLIGRISDGVSDVNVTSQGIRQTSSILWSLQDTYPGTYAAELAAVESLSLLEGWDDSLLLERIDTIEPSNPRYVEAARIARRAMARTQGQKATRALLDTLQSRAQTKEQRAGVHAIRVRSFIDSLQEEAALSAAQNLRRRYPNTEWAEWAERALYEVRNLLPGTTAPNITVRTLRGDTLSLSCLRGRPVVLEYFRPERASARSGRHISTRNTLYETTRSDSVAFVSVSVEPDTVVNEAFFSNRSFPGYRVIAEDGLSDPAVEAYNVVRTPVRFLIDAEGRIVGRYVGSSLLALQNDLFDLTGAAPASRDAR